MAWKTAFSFLLLTSALVSVFLPPPLLELPRPNHDAEIAVAEIGVSEIAVVEAVFRHQLLELEQVRGADELSYYLSIQNSDPVPELFLRLGEIPSRIRKGSELDRSRRGAIRLSVNALARIDPKTVDANAAVGICGGTDWFKYRVIFNGTEWEVTAETYEGSEDTTEMCSDLPSVQK